jgi:hypothetical protein
MSADATGRRVHRTMVWIASVHSVAHLGSLCLLASWLVAVPLVFLFDASESWFADWIGALPAVALLAGLVACILYTILLLQWSPTGRHADGTSLRVLHGALWIGWSAALIVVGLLALRASASGVADTFSSVGIASGSVLMSAHIWAVDAHQANRRDRTERERSLLRELIWTLLFVAAASLALGARPTAALAVFMFSLRIANRLSAIRRITRRATRPRKLISDFT